MTPYDATHLGHAANYLAFDLVNRAWRESGHRVRYVQNVTDVDDPLLERAKKTGQDWAEARSARDAALPRGHGSVVDHPARRVCRRRRVDSASGRLGTTTAGPRGRLRRRR
ncbi:MAG: hypothetical protein WKF82_00675 [Nocardioidaceae bacterium]